MCFTFERVMEVMGEAVKRLPREFTGRYPSVDWHGIAGMRDRLGHGYDNVDYNLLWEAVQTRIPGLLDTVDRMIRDIDESDS